MEPEVGSETAVYAISTDVFVCDSWIFFLRVYMTFCEFLYNDLEIMGACGLISRTLSCTARKTCRRNIREVSCHESVIKGAELWREKSVFSSRSTDSERVRRVEVGPE